MAISTCKIHYYGVRMTAGGDLTMNRIARATMQPTMMIVPESSCFTCSTVVLVGVHVVATEHAVISKEGVECVVLCVLWWCDCVTA